MASNYYLILGVGSDATPEQIRSAYRREAKRLHPDHSGEGCEPFQAVQEAYEVLGDPGRRQAYDDELDREKRAQWLAREARAERLQRRRPPVEPLIPNERPSGGGTPLRRSSFSDPIEELFRRVVGDWDTPSRSRVGRVEAGDIDIEVSLTREQVLHGGRIRVWLPGQIRCPVCEGWGRMGIFECANCFGRGSVVDEVPVDIAFPAGLADGSQARASLGRPGIGDLTLVLHFRVDEW